MEKTPEETLKTLALYYNEPLLYKQYAMEALLHTKHEVLVNVIEYKPTSDGKDSWGLKRYDVIVRVSSLAFHYSNSYLPTEIKWEGKLQDWYKACAEVVEQVTNKKDKEKAVVNG